MSSQEIRHAFFSHKQKKTYCRIYNRKKKQLYKNNHTNIYLTTNGKEVEVTEVCKEVGNYNKKYFTDSIYLGIVTKWVRCHYD